VTRGWLDDDEVEAAAPAAAAVLVELDDDVDRVIELVELGTVAPSLRRMKLVRSSEVARHSAARSARSAKSTGAPPKSSRAPDASANAVNEVHDELCGMDDRETKGGDEPTCDRSERGDSAPAAVRSRAPVGKEPGTTRRFDDKSRTFRCTRSSRGFWHTARPIASTQAAASSSVSAAIRYRR